MNKFRLLIALFAFALVSCNNKSSNQTENENTTSIDQTMTDAHTSEIALDWAGVYEGTMPCADCEGIEIVIELKDDHTYIAHYTYLGKSEAENKISNEGSFTWSDDGAAIALQAEGKPTQYKVGENHLILLNADGEVNTGSLAELYVLKKKI